MKGAAVKIKKELGLALYPKLGVRQDDRKYMVPVENARQARDPADGR
jgi:hypothetical protein